MVQSSPACLWAATELEQCEIEVSFFVFSEIHFDLTNVIETQLAVAFGTFN